MSEISAIAALKLSRLKRPFLPLSPSDQLDFIAALRERRARPRSLKHADSKQRRAKNVESKDQAQNQSQEPQG